MGTKGKRASAIFAEQLRRYREMRQLTAAQLADRVTASGGKLDRQAISKIERGVRGVYLDEWLVLAFALKVPPLLLFLPLDKRQEEEIQIVPVPGYTLPVDAAWRWIIGDQPPMKRREDDVLFADGLQEWAPVRVLVNLSTRLWDIQEELRNAELGFAAAVQSQDPDRRRQARGVYIDALTALAEVLDKMVEAGMDTPPQNRHRIEAMGVLGLPKHRDRIPVRDLPPVTDGPPWFTPPPLVDEEE